MTEREILTNIRKKNFAQVYILMGEEAYFIDRIVDALEQNVVSEDERDFNYSLFFGNDANLETVVASAQQYPFMAERKLVILKEAQSMYQAKSALEYLAGYVSHPSDNTVLVIVYKGDTLNATSKLLKAAKEAGAVVFRSDVPKDYNLATHIKDYCLQQKVSIEDKAVDMACEYIGAPLSKLFGELSKVIHIKGGTGCRITAEDIEKNVGVSKDYNQFALTSAIVRRDYPRAMRIVDYFAKNPKATPSVMVSASLFQLFSRVMIGHYTAEKTDQTLMQAMGLKSSYQLRDIKDAMRVYTPMEAYNAIHYIREFDTKSKGIGSYQNEFELMKELVFKLVMR